MRIKLPKIAKNHPIAFWLAVVLHLMLLTGLVFSSIQQWEIQQQEAKKPKPKFITPKAITIDLKEIQQEKQRLADIQNKKDLKVKREEQHLRKLEDERYKKQKRINRLKEKTEQEKKAKALAEKKRKLAEKKAKAAEQQKKLAEAKAKAAEQQKKLAEAKAKAAEQQKKLAEAKAKAAQVKKQAIEQQRKLESNQFKKEQNKRTLTKEIQAEQDQDREIAQEDILNELKINYINQIGSRVKSQWRYQGAEDSWGCKVHILQDSDGNVQSVDIESCNIDNTLREKSFKNSIERAVYKASPLPVAPDKSVFDSEIVFHFKVN